MKQAGPKTTSHGPVKQNVKTYKGRLCNLLVESGKAYRCRASGKNTLAVSHASARAHNMCVFPIILFLTLLFRSTNDFYIVYNNLAKIFAGFFRTRPNP